MPKLGSQKQRLSLGKMRQTHTRLTPKEELFCQGIAKGQGVADAHKNAGYICTDPSARSARAGKVISKPHIQLRIQQLKKGSATRQNISIDKITVMLLDTYDAAFAEKQYAVSARTAELLGKHLGMFIERMQHHHIIEGIKTGDTPKAIENDIARLILVAKTTEGYPIYVPADSEAPENMLDITPKEPEDGADKDDAGAQ